MKPTIFFDEKALSKRDAFELLTPLTTTEGKTVEIGEWLGRGGNASVFGCTDILTGEEYAVKFLLNIGEVSRKRFFRESKLLKSINDDHVIRYHGFGRVKGKHFKSNKKTQSIPFILLDLADETLLDAVSRMKNGVNYETYSGQFRGLSKALATVHKQAIHRDIKPENILISGQRWLLSDYGLCSFVEPDEEELTLEGQNVGPKFWLSPEAHNRRLGRNDKISKSSDVFQLAATFWYVEVASENWTTA